MVKRKKRKTKGRRKKRYKKMLKNRRLMILAAGIIILTVGLFTTYFIIDYVNGWSYTDRSLEGSTVTQGMFYGKEDTLHFMDPARHGLCFADVDFHSSYSSGTFSFYLMIADKSQLNLNMEFMGSQGSFLRWNNIQDEISSENIWYKFDYIYNFMGNVSNIYLNNILITTNITTFIPTNDFNRIMIKTNDDGIADLYIHIVSIS